MDKQLTAIRNALDKNTDDGRDLDTARKLADKYVADNPQKFEQFQGLDEDACCKAADVFNAAGMDEQVALVETWVRHHFEPQDIGGPSKATVRVLG